MPSQLNPKYLIHTIRGKKWLAQFKPEDREVAEKIVRSLTLVSHSEFERSIQKNLEKEVSKREGPFAFYAIREVENSGSYYHQFTDPITGTINALSFGSNHGSEARIAPLIRNYCTTDPGNLLNHPTIDEMRSSKCRTIILIDDFIGSGERTKDFIQSLWRDKTFTSWCSLKYIKVIIVAYSGTTKGVQNIKKHKVDPEVVLERGCPSFKKMPWRRKRIELVADFCKKYGSKTSKGYWWDGYGKAMVSLIFEHGCPDNAPVILWAPDEPNKPWQPLFPHRVVLSDEKSVFPPEIMRPDPVITLVDVGQIKLSQSSFLLRRGDLGQTILLILALIAQGQRKQIALSFATGLNEEYCTKIIGKCVKWGFITPSRRLTVKGKAELKAAKKFKELKSDPPSKGEEDYYPKQLKGITRG